MATTERTRMNPEVKKLFMEYCDSNEIHSVLNVTYRDVAERIISWLYRQPVETWNEVIKILESEIKASNGKCFTGKLSRLVSCLDGFHPDVRISIATSDQISNRVLILVNKSKDENLSKDEILELVNKELTDLELDEDQANEWIETVKDTLLDDYEN